MVPRSINGGSDLSGVWNVPENMLANKIPRMRYSRSIGYYYWWDVDGRSEIERPQQI